MTSESITETEEKLAEKFSLCLIVFFKFGTKENQNKNERKERKRYLAFPVLTTLMSNSLKSSKFFLIKKFK
jgi:hypothetical protein